MGQRKWPDIEGKTGEQEAMVKNMCGTPYSTQSEMSVKV